MDRLRQYNRVYFIDLKRYETKKDASPNELDKYFLNPRKIKGIQITNG